MAVVNTVNYVKSAQVVAPPVQPIWNKCATNNINNSSPVSVVWISPVRQVNHAHGKKNVAIKRQASRPTSSKTFGQ